MKDIIYWTVMVLIVFLFMIAIVCMVVEQPWYISFLVGIVLMKVGEIPRIGKREDWVQKRVVVDDED